MNSCGYYSCRMVDVGRQGINVETGDCTQPFSSQLCPGPHQDVLTSDSALAEFCPAEGLTCGLRELLRDRVLHHPPGEGGVQQGEGAGAELRGRGRPQQV